MVRPTRSHRFTRVDGQNAFPVYAVKPLDDKAFNLSWHQEPFCYTWHTLRPGGRRIREERGPR